MALKGIEITPFQSYFTDKIKVNVIRGAISTAGNLSFSLTEKKEIKVVYKGDASLTDFSSMDKQSGEDLLKLESLSFRDLNVGISPLSIDVKGISLRNFFARLWITPEGKINLLEMIKTEDQKKKGPYLLSQRRRYLPRRKGLQRLSKLVRSIFREGG